MSTEREQPWSDASPEHGRVVVVSDNPIGRAVVAIAEIAGRRTTLLADEGVEPTPLRWMADHPLGWVEHRNAWAPAGELCDHDAPQAGDLLRTALDGRAGYVAMMGSRRRAESVFAELEASTDAATLARLRVPAGLNTGGKAPGEIALSVVAEIVAVSYGRPGGPMKEH